VIGQTVSHYRILSKLGEGGMGTVYVAEDTLLGRRVAIKSLKLASVPSQKNYRQRFLREARAASQLNHPHIATIHEFGQTEDGQPYLVMELIEGQSLADLLHENSLPVDRAVGLVKQVVEAIAEAHRHGIIHRDIKPSNVVVNQRNEVKVLDFGLAKSFDPDGLTTQRSGEGENTTQTLEGVMVGTPAYVSPEQALGNYWLGALYQGQKKYDLAITEYEAALKKVPGAIEPLSGVVTVLMEQGKPDKATARVNQLLQATPGNVMAQSLLADVYVRRKNYAEAEAALRNAIRADPKAAGPYVAFANMSLARGDVKGAAAVLEEGANANPDQLVISMLLAEMYQRSGDIERAMVEYEKILKKDPHVDVAANNLASLLSETRRDKASVDRAFALAKRFETSTEPTFLDTLGWIYALRDEHSRAVPLLEKAVARAPQVASFHYHLGMALYKQGNAKMAKTHLQRAVDLNAEFVGSREAREVLAKL